MPRPNAFCIPSPRDLWIRSTVPKNARVCSDGCPTISAVQGLRSRVRDRPYRASMGAFDALCRTSRSGMPWPSFFKTVIAESSETRGVESVWP